MTTLAELDSNLLRCRTLGHAWDDFVPQGMKRAAFGTRLSFRCVRCTTIRHDICSWIDGSLVSRSYQYPDVYALDGKHARAEFRLALMHTLKPKGRQQR